MLIPSANARVGVSAGVDNNTAVSIAQMRGSLAAVIAGADILIVSRFSVDKSSRLIGLAACGFFDPWFADPRLVPRFASVNARENPAAIPAQQVTSEPAALLEVLKL